ncbi:MAG: tetratricopeptide repeat protein [Deltaproteobacteria bacterium]|nr:tetratricopeptide repeat protein [Deltaproteobacteria bacterium]
MSDGRTIRVAVALLALSWSGAGCAAALGGDSETLDEVLHRLDETSQQRVADAARIDDLQRRLAVLEALAAFGTSVAVEPATAETVASVEPPPDLPVVHVAPVPLPPEVEVAQTPDTRAAGAVAVQDPEEPADDPLVEDDPYEGVGFGNDPGGGYLQMGGARGSTTIRIQGTPPAPTAASTPSTLGTTNGSGGTPSSAFGELPRIPTMTTAPAVAAPAAQASAYDAGMEAYRAGRWQEAIGYFDRALAEGLGDAQVAQAQFLKAEATFQDRDWLGAIGLFERFLSRYPGSGRAPEALLRIGQACERAGDDDRAAQMYGRIVDEHPGSGAAVTAASRLEALGTEGRTP